MRLPWGAGKSWLCWWSWGGDGVPGLQVVAGSHPPRRLMVTTKAGASWCWNKHQGLKCFCFTEADSSSPAPRQQAQSCPWQGVWSALASCELRGLSSAWLYPGCSGWSEHGCLAGGVGSCGPGACLQPRCPWRWSVDGVLTRCLPTALARCSWCFYLRSPARAGPNTGMNFSIENKGSWSRWSFLIPSVLPCSHKRKFI